MSSVNKKIIYSLLIILGVGFLIYAVSAISYLAKCTKPRLSCLEHRKVGCNISGEYPVGSDITPATCDMETDKGGWTLVANYMHRVSGLGEAQALGPGVFPLKNQSVLGIDETGTPAWGHASLATMQALPFKEMRFRCQTSAHQHLVDFVIADNSCLNYFRTGKGSCLSSPDRAAEVMKTTRSMPGNGSHLPQDAQSGYSDQGEYAMITYPFASAKYKWGVRRGWGRFECDDVNFSDRTDTWHQIWVR